MVIEGVTAVILSSDTWSWLPDAAYDAYHWQISRCYFYYFHCYNCMIAGNLLISYIAYDGLCFKDGLGLSCRTISV